MALGDSAEEDTEKSQRAVDKVNNWTRKRLIKRNETESVHVDFTNKRCQHIPITINDKVILTQTQRNTLALRWLPSCAGRHM
jgi:regulator of extracellular matrix RemA (YlzA/DUF370 family)